MVSWELGRGGWVAVGWTLGGMMGGRRVIDAWLSGGGLVGDGGGGSCRRLCHHLLCQREPCHPISLAPWPEAEATPGQCWGRPWLEWGLSSLPQASLSASPSVLMLLRGPTQWLWCHGASLATLDCPILVG